jgi:hypothetical protein
MPKLARRVAGAALLSLLPFVPFAHAQQRSIAEQFTPPPCTPPGPYNDVPYQDPFCPWIQQLVVDQITSGCGGANYCPNSAVTRAQMAVFLELAMRGTNTWPAIPTGAVMLFNLAACPNGWSELTAAKGRYIVGLPSGGILAGTAGTPLTNQENRAAGQHSHTVTDPGHAHSYTNNAIFQNYCGGNFCQVQYGSAQTTGTSATGVSVDAFGTVPGTNAPYIQLLVCQKD